MASAKVRNSAQNGKGKMKLFMAGGHCNHLNDIYANFWALAKFQCILLLFVVVVKAKLVVCCCWPLIFMVMVSWFRRHTLSRLLPSFYAVYDCYIERAQVM